MVEQMLNTIAFPLDDTLYLANAEQAFLSSRGNGIYSEEGELVVNANNNMTVTVSPGRAWLHPSKFQGLVFVNFEPQTLEIALPDGFNKRIDRVVIQYDVPNNVVNLKIKQGVPSTNPKPPTLERNEFIAYELGIAEIHLDKGSTFISNSMIKDTRLDESVCGIMRDNVTRIPTQQLYNQFHDWYNTHTEQWKKEFTLWYTTNTTKWVEDFTNWYTTNTNQWTQEFQTWFDSIKGQLTGDIATNLSNQILELKNKTTTLENEVNTFKSQTNENINTINGNVSTLNAKVDVLEGKVGSTVADKATQDLIKQDTTDIRNKSQTLINKTSDLQTKVNELANNPTGINYLGASSNLFYKVGYDSVNNYIDIQGSGVLLSFYANLKRDAILTLDIDGKTYTFTNNTTSYQEIKLHYDDTIQDLRSKALSKGYLGKGTVTSWNSDGSPFIFYLFGGMHFEKKLKISVNTHVAPASTAYQLTYLLN